MISNRQASTFELYRTSYSDYIFEIFLSLLRWFALVLWKFSWGIESFL